MIKTQQEDFSRRLAAERQRLQLTQAEVAAFSGVSPATQIGYEQGLRSPSTEYTGRLRDLGFDVHYVMFGESSEDLASDTLDWELVGRIVSAVSAWCQSRGFEMKPEKYGEVIRLLYNEYRRKPATEVLDVGRLLKLVA